jgi:hypothetical protein
MSSDGSENMKQTQTIPETFLGVGYTRDRAGLPLKRLVEKKTTSQVAQETFHSPEEVEYYVQSLRRVLLCHSTGMSPEDIASATGRSLSLVCEYLELIQEFNLTNIPNDTTED